MSYRDPQRVIDDRYQRIATGIKGFFGELTKQTDAYKKRKADELKKARKNLNKNMDPYADEEREFMEEALKYSDDFKDDKQRKNYQSMIDENLLIIRGQLEKELSNPDLTNSEIQQIQLRGLKDLETFSNRVQMVRMAHLELEEGSSKEYGEAGYTTESKNPEFINILKDVKNGANFDLVNTSLIQSESGYKLGNAQYGVVLYKPDGEYEVESMIELEQFADMAQGESFFNTDEYPDVNAFNEFVMGDAMNDNRFTNQVERKNAKGKTVNQNVLNPNKLKYYLANIPAGDQMVESMFDGIGKQGYLRSKWNPKEHTQEEWEALISDKQVARDLTVDFLVEDAIFKANPGTIYRNRDEDGEVQTLAEGFELEEDALNLFTETADQQ